MLFSEIKEHLLNFLEEQAPEHSLQPPFLN